MIHATGPDGMQAGWIDGARAKLFVCHHPARGAFRRDCAVLMCDPFGSDRMNLQVSYRALALRLSEAGFAVLRLDYPGTGDSSGYPRDTEQLPGWITSLHTGADWLRRESGAQQLCAFGALLGGTLATQLAAARDDVSGLMLWGAFASGRAFLHEARAIRGLMASNPLRRRPSRWQEGDQETVGYLITRELAAALEEIDLLAHDGEVVRSAAVFRRGGAAADAALADKLAASGAEVYLQPSASVDITSLVNRQAVPPAALLDDMLAWATRTYPATPGRPAVTAAHARLATSTLLASPRGARVREDFVRFGPDRAIVGIVTEPPHRPRAEPAVVLVNGGTNHRPGINRNYTEWARNWAARGHAVLRLDLRGLGDSPPERGEPLCELHRPESRLDVRAAFDFLQARHGSTRFVCAGLCAGAHQALHTALEDERVTGLIMLNPLRFEGMDASFPEFRELDKHPIASRARAAFSPLKWVGALRGNSDLPRIARQVACQIRNEAAAAAQRVVSQLRGKPAPPATWMAGVFPQLVARSCDVLMVFNASEPIVAIVNRELGAERERLTASGRFAIELIDDTDHIFSPLYSQERLTEILDDTLALWRVPIDATMDGGNAQDGMSPGDRLRTRTR